MGDGSHTVTRVPRIVLVSDYPHDHVTFTSGVQTATASLLEGLRPFGSEFEFHVVSLTKSQSEDTCERRDGIWFHFLGIDYPRLPSRFPVRIFKVFRELRRIRPDLVHCQANLAGALAAVLGRHRRVMTVHGIGRYELPLRTNVPAWEVHGVRLLEKAMFDHFGPIICISEYARRIVGDRSLTFAIPNAVASRFFELERRTDGEPPRLVFAGMVAPLKRPADLVAAHARLRTEFPSLETLFVGPVEDEAYASAIHQFVSESHIEGVHFLGRLAREEVAELLSQATALVLPSAHENAPIVIAEAMAAGLPVVATRVGGVSEMVRPGETGFLYDAGDVNGLTACLGVLLKDPDLVRRLGRQGRARAQATYAPACVAEKMVATYRQLMAEP
jgi:glycosyltransferase involved in cell wall biosynthesis